MESGQITELLIRVDERVKRIDERFDELHKQATNGGWPRCMANMHRIEELEKTQADRERRARWFYRAGWGAVITVLVERFWTPLADLFTKITLT
jgi:hypothetical protein